ncbi:MAG TPA: hypothetical protein VHA74_01555 [Candidatus Dojkabacteria bacterium]|nr:hypothetical protein [Candidatus Dojkabacteria bacterium]
MKTIIIVSVITLLVLGGMFLFSIHYCGELQGNGGWTFWGCRNWIWSDQWWEAEIAASETGDHQIDAGMRIPFPGNGGFYCWGDNKNVYCMGEWFVAYTKEW